jgi:hypothetical protein
LDLVLGLLHEAVPPEAGDGEGGLKTGILVATSVDDTSEEVSVAVTAEAAVHLALGAYLHSCCLRP